MVPGGRADLRGAGDALSPEGRGRRAFVVFNPASGRGRGARRVARYRELVLEHFPGAEFGATEYAGHEYALADRAIEAGHDLIVAVGGDGTWSHVADRILHSGREDVVLGLLPAGTGNDFGRNLSLSYSDPADAVARLARGTPTAVDVGLVETPSVPAEASKLESDGERPRYFINVVGVGFDVAVIDAAAGARFLKGEVLYKVTALQQLFRFPGLPIEFRDGEGLERSRSHLLLTVTNGPYFGGGFPVTPDARIDDGLLHACSIGDASPLRRMALFNHAEKGRHVTDPEVELHTARRFRLTLPGPVRFEVDGDVFRTAGNELSLRLLPGALRVLKG